MKFIRNNIKIILPVALLLLVGLAVVIILNSYSSQLVLSSQRAVFWSFQSIDTMKYSRDLSREKINDSSFDPVIEMQMKEIAATGATHVAIATPYDEEFYPMLLRWVRAARKEHLSVWFRGNFSGWEGWFGYTKITRAKHLDMTRAFLMKHPSLFQDGDVFTACPECENGGPGDPRQTGDITGYRQFLIDEYHLTSQFFASEHKNVRSNFDSMNKDVATLIMDRATTKALGGIVTIDHYVESPEKLAADISTIVVESGGNVVLGEYGVPIPDINGPMTPEEQARWINDAGRLLVTTKGLIGVNYWVNTGGSTQLWDGNGNAREAVSAIHSLYSPQELKVRLVDALGRPIQNARLDGGVRYATSDKDGYAFLPYINKEKIISVLAANYVPLEIRPADIKTKSIVLQRTSESPFFKFGKFIRSFFAHE